MPTPPTLGIWVWNTASILDSPHGPSALIAGARNIGITDVYLYMSPSWYEPKQAALQNLIATATAAGLRIWGLDGDRAYLDDAAGPAGFYAGIDGLIAYNRSVAAGEQFFGFQADIEPQDDGSHASFHNDIPDGALSVQPGSGVWQSTQAQDRETLMRSWIIIYRTASHKLCAQGLQFGAAMPFWTEAYHGGGEVQVNFPSGAETRQGVMRHMMALLDEYVVMSYNTDPLNAASRVVAQAAYASTLPAASRPRVFASMEVGAGVGANVSYADTPGKTSKVVVMRDMEAIVEALGLHEAFGGVALHHWSSWQVMAD